MIIDYIEIVGSRRIWSSLDAWRYHEVYGQKCGYEEDDGEGYVWSNDNNNLVIVF